MWLLRNLLFSCQTNATDSIVHYFSCFLLLKFYFADAIISQKKVLSHTTTVDNSTSVHEKDFFIIKVFHSNLGIMKLILIITISIPFQKTDKIKHYWGILILKLERFFFLFLHITFICSQLNHCSLVFI